MRITAAWWLLCGLAAGASAQMRPLEVDASRVTGAIRSFQGVNDGPVGLLPQLADVSGAYQDLRIDLVRAHDFFGPTDIDARWPDPDPIARAVKADGANSIFPDWNADPAKEESYHFGPSDRVIQAIVNCGAEVYYRVGRSWSADPTPPPDFDKYANIVRHVAMHYNGGWASGFHYNIRYWEFWNEPDLEKSWNPSFVRPFWSGTPEQFYALYEKVARALKSYDPSLKVGTPGKAMGPMAGPYREGLMAYCAAQKVPLDFYSWHHYAQSTADPYDLTRIARQIRRLLDAHGFGKSEVHVTEWNISYQSEARLRAPMLAAAFAGATETYLQDSAVDRSLYYRGDASSSGMFDANGSYRKVAYVYKALGAMRDTPRRLSVKGTDTQGLAVVAGRSEDGNTVQVLIVNYEIPVDLRRNIRYENNRGYELRVGNLPWGKGDFTVRRYRLTPTESWVEAESTGRGGTLESSQPLPPPGVELVLIRRVP